MVPLHWKQSHHDANFAVTCCTESCCHIEKLLPNWKPKVITMVALSSLVAPWVVIDMTVLPFLVFIYVSVNFGFFLTYCGPVMPYGGKHLGQHWFRQWLVAWRHQAITWTNVDLSLRSSDVHLRAISLEISQPSVTNISLKIIFLRFYWNLPGANELICCRPSRYATGCKFRLTTFCGK